MVHALNLIKKDIFILQWVTGADRKMRRSFQIIRDVSTVFTTMEEFLMIILF